MLSAEDEFDDFYRAQYGRMLAIATTLCGDRATAEDLVQDAFLATHRAWGRVRAYDQPAAFLRHVLVNRGRSRWRTRRAEAAAIERYAGQRSVEPSGASEPPDEVYWAAVRALPRMQARCVVLRYVDDLDTAAIAAAVGCSEATVRVHLHRARRTLATRLGLEAD